MCFSIDMNALTGKKLHYLVFMLHIFCASSVFAQKSELKLDLEECIERATAGSLDAFRAKNQYLSSYWSFMSFKAGRLPSISFQFSPLQYTNSITQRYDYNQNIDVFRQQQSISSSGGISVSQKLDLTGGTFTFNTGLNYLRSSGESVYTQFSSTPVRLGYSQSLFGLNNFKWLKKIEPLKYERAQKQFLFSREDISQTAASHFFDLVSAQAEYDMAAETLSSADSLYIAGKERMRISSISQADLLTLELDLINAENALENASIQLNITRLSVEQSEQNLELELATTVSEFNKQQHLLKKAEEAMNMAIASYDINKQRFIVGKVDVNTLTLSQNRRKDAQRNYLSILSNYWNCYYIIRKLTLYDFENQESLFFQFDKLPE